MGKNYKAINHIKEQMTDYDTNLVNAIQRLFNIEDQREECQGCVVDSIVAFLIFKQFGINAVIHIGEICTDENQSAYHCWLTIDDKIFDIGIYGNSNYNPYFHGKKLNYPVVLENTNIQYIDGSTETDSWLSELSEKSVLDYIKKCPQNRVCKLYCKSLDIIESVENQDKIYKLAEHLYFPKLIHLSNNLFFNTMNKNDNILNQLNQLATEQFIEEMLSDVENEIKYIEKKYNKTLIGDRSAFNQARNEWKQLTCGQILHCVSEWKMGIRNRYLK